MNSNRYTAFTKPAKEGYIPENLRQELVSPEKQEEGRIRRAVEEAQEQLDLDDLLGEVWDE
jgi:hypothetical protein